MNIHLFRWRRWLFPFLLVPALLAACGDGDDDAPGATLPGITAQPASITVAEGAPATFAVAASGTAPLAYQWRRNGADIGGATAASFTTPPTVAADTGTRYSVVISNSAGQVASGEAVLTVTPSAGPPPPVAPVITAHPASTTVSEGQAATFSAAASGTAPLAYQWRRNGTGISGANAASFSTAPATLADNGSSYSVIVSNAAGQAVSNEAVLTVTATPVAPAIAQAPASVTVNPGQVADFSVTATGTAPLAYQWMKNNAPIAGATAASYSTPPVTAGDTGSVFHVVVSNAAGSATSAGATLTVMVVAVAPTITAQPAAALTYEGFTASFSVQASGTAPLSYQWRRNGADIAGAVAASYITPLQSLANNGDVYQVTVSNAAGAVSSNEVALTVLPYP